VKKVTIVHQAAFGDTVLLIPLIRSLRQRFAAQGGAAITVVTHANLGQMLTMTGLADGYASADAKVHSLWFAGGTDAKPTEWSNCDVLISAVSGGNDAWAAHARGLSTAETLLFFDPRPPADYCGHVTRWHREQLAELGLFEPALPLPRRNPEGAIVIHPGSGGELKCWPRENFLQLARDLRRNGIVPTMVLGEAEEERWGQKVIDELQSEFPWYRRMGFYELAEKLLQARLYLGNDSGVSHLAAAMGVPVIALFGPSNDVQWRPIGPSVRVLRPPPPHARELAKLEAGVVLEAMLAELRQIA
jgi:heptosyltransferase III